MLLALNFGKNIKTLVVEAGDNQTKNKPPFTSPSPKYTHL